MGGQLYLTPSRVSRVELVAHPGYVACPWRYLARAATCVRRTVSESSANELTVTQLSSRLALAAVTYAIASCMFFIHGAILHM